ncbi:MAG: hypothetical protein KC502_08815 [Myxococcales bacterium]|nr:hypothetical protein [Myxococcales bacterium]
MMATLLQTIVKPSVSTTERAANERALRQGDGDGTAPPVDVGRVVGLIVCLTLSIAGCGTDPSPAQTPSDGSGTFSCPKVIIGNPEQPVSTGDLNIAVSVLGKKYDVKGSVVQPTSCTAQSPCPLVVIVPDRDANPWPEFNQPAKLLAGNAGVVVAIFNLPGRGNGGLASEGTDDYGGTHHTTAVKEIMRVVRSRKFVDDSKTGFVSIGYGLVPTASAFKIFGPNTLKDTLFLIDVEGPTDRCAASQAPQKVTKGIGPDHGPGVTDSACHFDKDGTSAEVYPGASGDVPASIACATGAWPITKTGEDCTSDWWAGREPATTLKSFPARYQRLQFVHDARLPTHWSSRVAIGAVSQSKSSSYFGLNDMQPCQTPLSDETCNGLTGGQQCWLSGAWGTGRAPGSFGGPQWCEVTTTELFALILPKYVGRMLDTKTYPNCK